MKDPINQKLTREFLNVNLKEVTGGLEDRFREKEIQMMDSMNNLTMKERNQNKVTLKEQNCQLLWLARQQKNAWLLSQKLKEKLCAIQMQEFVPLPDLHHLSW